mgnify:CR=1 FL=1
MSYSLFNCIPSIPSNHDVSEMVEKCCGNDDTEANKNMDDLIDKAPGGFDKSRCDTVEGRTEFVFERLKYIMKNLPYFGPGFPMYDRMKDCLELDMEDRRVLAGVWGKFIERMFLNEEFKKTGREDFLTWMRSSPFNSLKLITNLQTLIYIRRLQEIVDERKRDITTQPCGKRDEPGCSAEPDSGNETEEDNDDDHIDDPYSATGTQD